MRGVGSRYSSDGLGEKWAARRPDDALGKETMDVNQWVEFTL